MGQVFPHPQVISSSKHFRQNLHRLTQFGQNAKPILLIHQA
jgi:hypothetical protein